MNTLEQRMKEREELQSYAGEDRVVWSQEVQDRIRAGKERRVVYSSGIPGLDKHCEGFAPGQLITVSGPTGNGKTSLCRVLTRNFEDRGVNCVWFSFEEREEEFLSKFTTLPSFLLPNQIESSSLAWVEKRIQEARVKYENVRVVFIDHLHYLFSLGTAKNASLLVGDVVRKLKRMAGRQEVALFLVCHLHKLTLEAEPDENDLRDSSFIAQESNKVLMVWRRQEADGEFENRAVLKICKDRETGVKGRKVSLAMVNGYLEEEATSYVPF